MTKTKFFVLAAALGAAAVWAVLSMRQPVSPAPARTAEPDLFPFVRALEGTRPDGEVGNAAGATLKADRELRNLFEYYLAATGEMPLDQIRAAIERDLDRRLQAPLAAQARQLLARYLDYKRELAEVEKNPALAGNGTEAIRGRLQALRQVRGRFFSEQEIDGMFGLDDAYDNDMVARLEISRDQSLSAEQKRARLAALDAALPPALREAREKTMQPVMLAQEAATMRAHGASDDDVYRMRAATVGAEAAARLAAVDREQSAWQARIASYLSERKKLVDSMAPSDAARPAALQQLRDAHFNADEQKRLAAYEPVS